MAPSQAQAALGLLASLCSAIILRGASAQLLPPLQLADNLFVSGSDKPMSYGIGTSGLSPIGTDGLATEHNGVPVKYPTVIVSDLRPGATVIDGNNVTTFASPREAVADAGHIMKDNIRDQLNGSPDSQESALANVAAHGVRTPFSAQTAASESAAPLNTAATAQGRRLAAAAPAAAISVVGTALESATRALAGEVATATAPGLPTVASQNGTFRVVSNNGSGNQVQLSRDGTFSGINGGNSPGILTVGPNGISFERDNALGAISPAAQSVVAADADAARVATAATNQAVAARAAAADQRAAGVEPALALPTAAQPHGVSTSVDTVPLTPTTPGAGSAGAAATSMVAGTGVFSGAQPAGRAIGAKYAPIENIAVPSVAVPAMPVANPADMTISGIASSALSAAGVHAAGGPVPQARPAIGTSLVAQPTAATGGSATGGNAGAQALLGSTVPSGTVSGVRAGAADVTTGTGQAAGAAAGHGGSASGLPAISATGGGAGDPAVSAAASPTTGGSMGGLHPVQQAAAPQTGPPAKSGALVPGAHEQNGNRGAAHWEDKQIHHNSARRNHPSNAMSPPTPPGADPNISGQGGPTGQGTTGAALNPATFTPVTGSPGTGTGTGGSALFPGGIASHPAGWNQPGTSTSIAQFPGGVGATQAAPIDGSGGVLTRTPRAEGTQGRTATSIGVFGRRLLRQFSPGNLPKAHGA